MIEVGSEEEAARGTQGRVGSRPTRRAARAAHQRMLEAESRQKEARGSDDESEGEESENGLSSEGESSSVEGSGRADETSASLSAYELERQRNILANQSELLRLGLAGGEPSPKPRRKPGLNKAAASRSAEAPVRRARSARLTPATKPSRSTMRSNQDLSHSSSQSDMEEELPSTLKNGKSNGSGEARSQQKRPLGAMLAAQAAVDAAAEEQALSLFEVIRRSSGRNGLLRMEDIRYISNDLRLGLTEDDMREMIDLFGGSSTGGLTFREFFSVVQLTGIATKATKAPG